MELSEAIQTLHQKMFYYDWYAKKVDVNPILHKSIVVYVHRINAEVYAAVPDKIDDWDVRVHFFASYNAKADSFKVDPKSFTVNKDAVFTPAVAAQLKVVEPVIELTEEDFDISEEVWQLSKKCGWQTLEQIFYEIHDGVNAVSDRSKEFPGVRAAVQELYNLVGFDVLAEEIE